MRQFRWRAILAVFLSVCLVLGLRSQPVRSQPLTPPLAQRSFADLRGHWAEACLTRFVEKKILTGYPDGTLRPDAPVNRAVFATMVTAAFPNLPAVRSPRDFRDVPSTFWGYGAIQKAYRAGFFSGYPDGNFRPMEATSRAQALTALASGLGWKPTEPIETTLSLFQDRAEVPTYAKGAIASATEKRVVVNYPNLKQVRAQATASRAELAAFLCQAMPDTIGLISSQYVPQPKPAIASEIRGVWLTNIDSDVLFDRDRLKNAIRELAQQGFNTIYPAVWNWGYTLYPSKVMEAAIGIAIDPRPAGLKDRDPLQEIIAEAKQQGMAVIPWFEFGFMAPEDSELARTYPAWLSKKQDGGITWLEGQDFRAWLSPFQPQSQKLILDLVTEIVTQYQVDGIQFDDHFGLPVEFGYEPATLQAYQQEKNLTTIPQAEDPDWIRWRADRITAFLSQLFKTIKTANPKAIVALSPNPYSFAYNKSLQDWKTWERNGLIEELIVQVYKDSQTGFERELAQPELLTAQGHIPTGIGILSGLKGKAVPLSQIEQQVKTVRDRGYSGVSFFFYETLWNLTREDPNDRKQGIKRLFTPTVPRLKG